MSLHKSGILRLFPQSTAILIKLLKMEKTGKKNLKTIDRFSSNYSLTNHTGFGVIQTGR
jgi:hypothetical protein